MLNQSELIALEKTSKAKQYKNDKVQITSIQSTNKNKKKTIWTFRRKKKIQSIYLFAFL